MTSLQILDYTFTSFICPGRLALVRRLMWSTQRFIGSVQTFIKGSLVCKTSVLRTFNSCSTTTHHTPLIIHHSSNHHSSYTTHQTTTHHTPLIIHHSSNHHSSNHHSSYTTHQTTTHQTTTHHTPLIIHHSSYTTHQTTTHQQTTTHHTPLIKPPLIKPPLIIHHSSDFVAGAAICEPPCADFVAGAIQNAFSRDSGRTKCCIFQ